MKLPFPQEIICRINKFTGSPTATLIKTHVYKSNVDWDIYDRLVYKYSIYKSLCYKKKRCILPLSSFNESNEPTLDMIINYLS